CRPPPNRSGEPSTTAPAVSDPSARISAPPAPSGHRPDYVGLREEPMALKWIGVVAAAFLAAGGPVEAETDEQADRSAVGNGNPALAFDLYSRLRASEGNVCFSPYSVSTALAMTYAGARGQTAAEMSRTLHLPFEGDRLHGAFAAVIRKLNNPGSAR